MIPQEILDGEPMDLEARQFYMPSQKQYVSLGDIEKGVLLVYGTLVTSMFLHVSWGHVIGNMVFLWAFGWALEDRLGKGRYLLFYILCGIAAALAHVAQAEYGGMGDRIPFLGASGATAGLLGAYFLFFNQQAMWVLIGVIPAKLPSWVMILVWVVLQTISFVLTFGANAGIAYGAHLGGFAAGMLLTAFLGAAREGYREKLAWR
jgi:membrane associated rhomboid family serine protease